MASPSLKKRLGALASQLDKVQGMLRARRKSKDWRRTIGAFTDDKGMQQILRDAMRLRDADRKKARPKSTVKRKARR